MQAHTTTMDAVHMQMQVMAIDALAGVALARMFMWIMTA
jgi:hypothetical protein